VAESKDSPKSTRKVKNPETFRERAIKASEQSDQPKRSSRIKSAAGKPIRPVLSSVKRVRNNKVVRTLTAPFRFIGRFLLPKYFRESYQELKLVEWPNRKTSRQLTFAVLIFAFIFAVIVSIIDFGLDKLFKEVLLK
jgi:preprotein translocase SecE subunit